MSGAALDEEEERKWRGVGALNSPKTMRHHKPHEKERERGGRIYIYFKKNVASGEQIEQKPVADRTG